MLTINFFKGLHGSGKSTEARRMMREHPGRYTRVNKDDLREMMHGGKHSKGNETEVCEARDHLIMVALLAGRHVIVDDTNFHPKHRAAMDALAEELRKHTGRQVQVVERYFDVPLLECIERDRTRVNGVGEEVIRRMYREYVQPTRKEPDLVPYDPALESCVIVDLDGTLAKMKGRGPYDWDKVGQDELHRDIKELVELIDIGNHGRTVRTIICSGRDEVCRPQTVAWLAEHGICYDALYMRPRGSNEKDSVLKEWMYRHYIAGKYNVLYVLDDRNQVVEMWRRLGLRCLQVAEGNF